MKLAQEPGLDRVTGRAADHRIDAALRAQRGLRAIDPGLDIRGRERAKTEEAAAQRAVGELEPVLAGVGVGFDATSRIGGGGHVLADGQHRRRWIVARLGSPRRSSAKSHPRAPRRSRWLSDEPDQGLTKLEEFVTKNPIGWPHDYQGEGFEADFVSSWGINAIPRFFVVDGPRKPGDHPRVTLQGRDLRKEQRLSLRVLEDSATRLHEAGSELDETFRSCDSKRSPICCGGQKKNFPIARRSTSSRA